MASAEEAGIHLYAAMTEPCVAVLPVETSLGFICNGAVAVDRSTAPNDRRSYGSTKSPPQ